MYTLQLLFFRFCNILYIVNFIFQNSFRVIKPTVLYKNENSISIILALVNKKNHYELLNDIKY